MTDKIVDNKVNYQYAVDKKDGKITFMEVRNPEKNFSVTRNYVEGKGKDKEYYQVGAFAVVKHFDMYPRGIIEKQVKPEWYPDRFNDEDIHEAVAFLRNKYKELTSPEYKRAHDEFKAITYAIALDGIVNCSVEKFKNEGFTTGLQYYTEAVAIVNNALNKGIIKPETNVSTFTYMDKDIDNALTHRVMESGITNELKITATAKNNFQKQIINELVKHGWEIDPRDNTNVVIARWKVNTFKGIDTAMIHPPVVHEDGLVAVHAEFISKGENALSLCHAYIKTEEEIPAKIDKFHEEIICHLFQAFSVRMAKGNDMEESNSQETIDKLKETITATIRKKFPDSYLKCSESTLGGNSRPSLSVHFALGKDTSEFPNGIIHNDNGHTVFLVHCKRDEKGTISNLKLDGAICGYNDPATRKNDKLGWRDIKNPTDIAGIERNISRYFDKMYSKVHGIDKGNSR